MCQAKEFVPQSLPLEGKHRAKRCTVMGKHIMVMTLMGAKAKLWFETQDALTLGANPIVV